MGITIIQRSDLSVRKENAKVALVLAGGAVTGGAFKLGGLKALDDFLVNRKTTDFDVYVGLSAGAFLAAPLAAGISPAEMVRSVEGSSDHFSAFRAGDFYNMNVAEYVERPLRFWFDLATYFPGVVLDFLAETPTVLENLRSPAAEWWRRPTPSNFVRILAPIARGMWNARSFPFPLDYMPSGFFDNAPIERYLRRNIERNGLTNDFRVLYRISRRELYIVAMNLDTAERAVFGHNEDNSATISEAVQASTALPGFYKPARINGAYYVDGGVRRTANVDVAIEHGAQLILCYNPFRPYYNRLVPHPTADGERWTYDGVPLSSGGMIAVLNQVFRTLLHSRLQYALREYQRDPNFRGDLILIEPTESDFKFFRVNPLAFWERRWAAEHGYVTVTESIERHFDRIRQILETYGIQITRRETRKRVEQLKESKVKEPPAAANFLSEEVPRRNVTVA
jgi:predicted acylesterase/phospholipase RssA